MSPAMSKEVQNFGKSIADPVKKYTTYLANEPQGGLRHVNAHLTTTAKKIIDDGKLELLSSLQESREVQLNLHQLDHRKMHSHTAASSVDEDHHLDSVLRIAEQACNLALEASNARAARRQSLVPTLTTLMSDVEMEGSTATNCDNSVPKSNDDFSQWYEDLFDSPKKK